MRENSTYFYLLFSGELPYPLSPHAQDEGDIKRALAGQTLEMTRESSLSGQHLPPFRTAVEEDGETWYDDIRPDMRIKAHETRLIIADPLVFRVKCEHEGRKRITYFRIDPQGDTGRYATTHTLHGNVADISVGRFKASRPLILKEA